MIISRLNEETYIGCNVGMKVRDADLQAIVVQHMEICGTIRVVEQLGSIRKHPMAQKLQLKFLRGKKGTIGLGPRIPLENNLRGASVQKLTRKIPHIQNAQDFQISQILTQKAKDFGEHRLVIITVSDTE